MKKKRRNKLTINRKVKNIKIISITSKENAIFSISKFSKMAKIDLTREIRELKTHLSYSKNLGFFFGAGTSCALGIPNIEELTTAVGETFTERDALYFKSISEELATRFTNRRINIEDILNHIRIIRELTGESSKQYGIISGEEAKRLDREICSKIYDIILEKEKEANLSNTKKFYAWLNILNRDFPKEVFTTNYDLIFEKALEADQIPYFDGFIGSYEPFFWQESIERHISKEDLTQNWIRIWKIHGSLNWFWKEDDKRKTQKIIRIGRVDNIKDLKNELVIYPSREKYDSSRKQPFIAYFDRLKNYLLNGELLFIFSGYSFSDQHINEIVFNCMRQNNRLSVIVFCYDDKIVENLFGTDLSYLNLSVYGPTKAIINGSIGEWEFVKDNAKNSIEKYENYWNESENRLILGDFNSLVAFLVNNSGKKDIIESLVQ